jgi:hypothetical protein
MIMKDVALATRKEIRIGLSVQEPVLKAEPIVAP